MPTIEIVSIGTTYLGVSEIDFSVSVIEEHELVSHRSLFYDFLRGQSGTIIHIGNPEFRTDKNSGFYAGKLIDWDFEPGYITLDEGGEMMSIGLDGDEGSHNFKFYEQFRADVDTLLKTALEKSPERKAFFLTDYQFGPKQQRIETNFTINMFWELHEVRGIRFNTLYEITE